MNYSGTPRLNEQIQKAFTYHPPIAELRQAERYEEIRSLAFEFARSLATRCPESRELSLALTSLEQAVMWANAAIARNEKLDDCPF